MVWDGDTEKRSRDLVASMKGMYRSSCLCIQYDCYDCPYRNDASRCPSMIRHDESPPKEKPGIIRKVLNLIGYKPIKRWW